MIPLWTASIHWSKCKWVRLWDGRINFWNWIDGFYFDGMHQFQTTWDGSELAEKSSLQREYALNIWWTCVVTEADFYYVKKMNLFDYWFQIESNFWRAVIWFVDWSSAAGTHGCQYQTEEFLMVTFNTQKNVDYCSKWIFYCSENGLVIMEWSRYKVN